MKLGRFTEARIEIQRAISITMNLREQQLLAKRLKQLEKAAFSVIGAAFSFEARL
jgi:predicted RNA polymerase sigma factor